jgi:hypothetical protein
MHIGFPGRRWVCRIVPNGRYGERDTDFLRVCRTEDIFLFVWIKFVP